MDLDPQLIQQMMALGEQDPQAPKVARQQSMIDRLRAAPFQRDQGMMAGKAFLPGNTAATALGDIAGGAMAAQAQPGVDQAQQGIIQRRVNTRQGYTKALIDAMRRQAPQPQQPGGPMQIASTGMNGPYSTPQAGY